MCLSETQATITPYLLFRTLRRHKKSPYVSVKYAQRPFLPTVAKAFDVMNHVTAHDHRTSGGSDGRICEACTSRGHPGDCATAHAFIRADEPLGMTRRVPQSYRQSEESCNDSDALPPFSVARTA